MEKTPYEQGKEDGQSVIKDLRGSGCETFEECLEGLEQLYQADLALLHFFHAGDVVYAAWHAQWLEGYVSAARALLRGLIASREGGV